MQTLLLNPLFTNERLTGKSFKEAAQSYWKEKWVKNGYLHRGGLKPALVYKNGLEMNYYKGNYAEVIEDFLFCKSICCIIRKNGTIESYKNIERHYILNNDPFNTSLILHRSKFPAIEYANGDKEWWYNGKRHRLDGPAVIYGDKKFWFENGEFIKCSL